LLLLSFQRYGNNCYISRNSDFIFIGKNYKTEEFKNINLKQKDRFRGDLLNHEAGLLVALMAKVAKADGKVCESLKLRF
jgi:hypothetical protein